MDELEKALEAKLELILDDAADAILEISQNLIIQNSTDRGILHRSGDIEKPGKLERIVVYRAAHSAWIEYGTPPHPVSEKGREEITAWAKRKGIREYAQAIIWKIRKKGTEPKPFLRPAVAEVRMRLPELMGRRGL